MERYGNSGKQNDQPAKKSGSSSKRKAGPGDKQGSATQQVQQDNNAQQSPRNVEDGGPDRKQSVMSLSEDEAGSSDVDTQALPGIPGNSIAENADERHQKISVAAYARAEHRGFEPGKEEDDWLSAEAELYGGYTRDGEDQEQSGNNSAIRTKGSKNYNDL